jgi:cytosine/adenosine deaminase-related metal-dependent hydrolase
MTYRKFKADYLFTGREMAGENAVLVTEEDGTIHTILPLSEAGEGVEVLKGILSPGFVNCHCHLELSHMKGRVPEKTGLVDFLLAVMGGRDQGAGDEKTRMDAIADAEQSMLDCGIVAVGDICNTIDTITQKAMGRLFYHNFIETMGFSEQGAAARFEQGRTIFEAFSQAYTLPIEANSLVPHAPYSVSSAFPADREFPGQSCTFHP